MQNNSPRHHICQLPSLRLLPRYRPLLRQLRPRSHHLNKEFHRKDHMDLHRGHRRPSVLRVRPHHRDLQDLAGQDTGGAIQGLLPMELREFHCVVVGGHGEPECSVCIRHHRLQKAGS